MRSHKKLRGGFFLLWGLVIAGSVIPVASQQRPDDVANTGAEKKATVDYKGDIMTNRSAKDSTIYLIGNVAFHHNGTIIECDSAHRYDDYRLVGFGNVIINKDSTFIYGDRVSYNGHTHIATVYSPIIKLVNGDLTMWVNDMIEFNIETSVGNYRQGGVIVQRDNLMESDRGRYFGDSSVIVFAGNVALKNDNYVMKTDSIGYNLDQEMVTFLTWTYIWDKERDFLLTEKGDYVRATETYHFTRNAYVMTEDQEFWADTMNYETIDRLVTMLGNIQILDATQRTIALGDEGYYSDSLNKGMLTRLPAVISYEEMQQSRAKDTPDTTFTITAAGDTLWDWKQNEIVPDSAYMRADTIFFDTYPIGTTKPLPAVRLPAAESPSDSTAVESLGDSVMLSRIDSLAVPLADTDSLGMKMAENQKDTLPRSSAPSSEAPMPMIAREDPLPDSVYREMYGQEALDSLQETPVDSTIVVIDSSGEPEKQPDSMERVIRAYYHAGLFRSDVQGIADSIISYSVDSSASLFGQPIIWNGNNQLTADQINVYSGNEQLEYAEYIGTPFLTQKVERADSLFNQAQSRYMETWFQNNEIVRALMSGNVENFYYMGEDNRPPDKFFTISAATLTVDFEDREPIRMNWGGNASWSVYPIDSIPANQVQRLSGFSWEPGLKPKDRYAITLRSVRPSVRNESNGYVRPEFVIDRDLMMRKEELIRHGIWRDRNDVLRFTIQDF